MTRRSSKRDAVTLVVGGASDVGRLRSANEDSLLRDDEARLYAVADGMGGHRAGDVASATALEAFGSRTEAGDPLDEALEAANAQVFEKARDNPEMRGMGTTVTAVKVEGSVAHLAHVGDSRAYLLRDGALTQVTDDHSLVEELVREGRLTPEEAAVHPQRSIITRALGVDESVEVDTYEVDLRDGDRLLLCSDGLTSMVRDDQIADLLRGQDDPQTAADALVEAANDAGGEDNISVLVIDVTGGPDGAARARQASRALGDTAAADATGEWERPFDFSGPDDEGDEAGDTEPRRRRWAPSWSGVRRALLWVVPFLFLVAVVVVALGWYARRTYFVGLDGEQVTVFQGVPGGFLGWDPTVEGQSDVPLDDLTPHERQELEDGKRFSDRDGAERYVAQLERRAERRAEATTTTRPPPTTTSVLPTTAP